jgi:hypothetical protein
LQTVFDVVLLLILDADKILCPITAQLGWSDPTNYFGHGYVYKSGVAPAQSGVLSAPKFTSAPWATCSPSGSSENPMVTQRVTEEVIRVFHAPFTLGRSIRKKGTPSVNPKSIRDA